MIKKIAQTAVILAAVVLLGGQTEPLESLDDAFEKSVVIIETKSSGCFRFDVYVAMTRDQQRRGLMFVRELDEFAGMLFVYRRASALSMWMKNTYLPLDILFAKGDGQVSSVESNTEPLSLRSISAVEPVNFVLELNAGVAAKIGIDNGSRLIIDLPQ